MMHAVLLSMALLPQSAVAQESVSSPTNNQIEVPNSIQAKTSSTSGDTHSNEPLSVGNFGLNPDQNAPQQTSTKPRQSPKPAPEPTPKIPPSMVGYIDDAIVGSQVRVRFDAAFGDNASDRAEFFYAQYAGINGPGPKVVVADLNFQQLYLNGEYAPKKNTRFSFFAEVPVRWIQPQSTLASTTSTQTPPNVNEAGLSDVSAGFKLAVVASPNQYLTLQFKAYFPSGNASAGLGTNHYTFEPALLYYRRLSDRFTLEAEVGDSHPIGGSSCPTISPSATYPNAVCIAPPLPTGVLLSGSNSSFAGDVLFYGVGPSYVLYQGRTVQIAPVIELVGWSVLGGLVTDNTTATPAFQQAMSTNGVNIVTLKVGARTSIGKHNSFYIGGGYAVTHSRWYKDILRVEYRYSF